MAPSSPDEFQTLVSLLPGELLCDRYKLVRQIGRGGMGVVWLAEDTRLENRPVAIKLLPAVLASNERAVMRMKREAITCLELSHPHIVRLMNFEQDPTRGDVAFLVMAFVDGKTLDQLLASHPDGLPLERATKWASQLASALDYAHSKGVLHRDIKPSNVMIDGNDDAFLMDFGIAREARDTMTRVTGRDSSGTLPYMSPQQVMGENSKSNDIYSLAATLYEALKGEPPFTTGDLVQQIRLASPQPICGQQDHVNEVLLGGLAKLESARPARARELVQGLFGLAASVPAHPAEVQRRRDSIRRSSRPAPQLAPPSRSCTFGECWTNQFGMTFTLIDPLEVAPSGFFMGAASQGGKARREDHPHQVTLTQPFWLGVTLVTQSQWHHIMSSAPSYFRAQSGGLFGIGGRSVDLGDHPVEQVSWSDAQNLCDALRSHDGRPYRLPSEAEWEFACRAGSTSLYSFGDADFQLADYAICLLNSGGQTHAVAGLKPNAWGLYDMHGNVWEWCSDWYAPHSAESCIDPVGPATGRRRVIRGGSWNDGAEQCRSAARQPQHPAQFNYIIGVRLAIGAP